jgi:ribonuclease T1
VHSPMVQALKNTARKRLCAVAVVVGSVLCTTLGYAKAPNPVGGLETIQLAQLPPQGRVTYQLIQQGGPFPFDKDGTVFGNRERILPLHQRGYYREYTVKTAGAGNRGAKRIVCGGPPRAPDACFYTSDHYASFRYIVE